MRTPSVILALTMIGLQACAPPSRGESDDAAPIESAVGEDVIASADGVTFTEGDWERVLDSNSIMRETRFRSAEVAEGAIRRAILGHLIARLESREIERAEFIDTPEDEARLVWAERVGADRWARLWRFAREVEVTDEMILARHREDSRYHLPTRLRIRHLFLSGGEERSAEAHEIATALQASPGRFTEMEQEHSDSLNAAPGTVYGPLDPSDVTVELRDVVWSLDEGALSEPLRSEVGWHIVEVVERMERGRTAEQASAEIREALITEGVDQRVEEIRSTAGERLGLVFPKVGDDVSSTTVLVTGEVHLTLVDAALGFGIPVADLLAQDDLAESIENWQRMVMLERWAQVEAPSDDPRLQAFRDGARRDALRELLTESRLTPTTEESLRAQHRRWISRYTDRVLSEVQILALRASASSGEEVRRSDLLRKAMDLREEAEGGASFADLIQEHSAIPDAEPRWLAPLREERGLYLSVADLATGEISEPIERSGGYDLVKVLTIRRNVPRPFEEVRDQLRGEWRQEQLRHAHQAMVDGVSAEVAWTIPEALILRHVQAPSE